MGRQPPTRARGRTSTVTITELCCVRNLDLRVHYNAMLCTYQANIEHACVKCGCMLRGEWGGGPTADAAVADYVRRIKGKALAVQLSSGRIDFSIPETLTP